jgi:PST family polysaccharide transporter
LHLNISGSIKNQSSYSQILKSNSIFGGVQFINNVISLIRSKFLAVLLGPSGEGLRGLYNSATQLVTSFIDLGVSASAVRGVCRGDSYKKEKTVTVVIKIHS